MNSKVISITSAIIVWLAELLDDQSNGMKAFIVLLIFGLGSLGAVFLVNTVVLGMFYLILRFL